MFKEKVNILLGMCLGIPLFFPMHYFNLYYPFVSLLCFLTLLIFNEKKRVTSTSFFFSFAFLLYLSLGSVIRFFVFENEDVRDFIEIGRFVPIFVLLVFSYILGRIKFKVFLWVLKLYLCVDFVITLLQYLKVKNPILKNIEKLYSNDIHIEKGLDITGRTLGLSTGPGEHGLTILVVISILLMAFLKNLPGMRSRINGFFLMLGGFCIVSSQSQTAFVGFALLHLIILFLFLLKGSSFHKTARRVYMYFFSFVLGAGTFITYYLDELRYLLTLFELGLNRSSYENRGLKREAIIEKAFDEPLGILLGWGKSFFKEESTAMDNEHLYIFAVYGPIVYIAFWGVLFFFLRKILETRDNYTEIFAVLMLLGIPLAWPNTYYLSAKIMFILTFFFISFYDKENTPARKL